MSFSPTVTFQIKKLKARELCTYSTEQEHIKAQLPYELVSTCNGFKAILINEHHLHCSLYTNPAIETYSTVVFYNNIIILICYGMVFDIKFS